MFLPVLLFTTRAMNLMLSRVRQDTTYARNSSQLLCKMANAFRATLLSMQRMCTAEECFRH